MPRCSGSNSLISAMLPFLGHYCPSGTNATLPCPAGTFNPSVGIGFVNQCLGCTAGQYCQGFGLNVTTGNCSLGYYCSGNASVPNPTDGSTGKFFVLKFPHYVLR